MPRYRVIIHGPNFRLNLTKDEVPEFLWTRISRADADKDGLVTQPELEAARNSREPRH